MKQRIDDKAIERMVSVLLRSGVLFSGAVVLIGGAIYLAVHGGDPADYRSFHGQPSIDRILPQIVHGAITLRPLSIIQFGLVLLIATPIARVVLSLIGFTLERDRTYVIITAIVLVVLLFSLISGAALG